LAVALADLATPMLPGVIRAALFYGTRDEMVRNGKIAEMQFFAKGWFGISTAVIAGIIAIFVVIRRKQLRVGDVLCLVVGAVLLFLLARFTPIFAMASIPPFAATIPRLRDEVLAKRSTVLLLAIVTLIGAVRLVRSFPRKNQTLTAWLRRVPSMSTSSATARRFRDPWAGNGASRATRGACQPTSRATPKTGAA
jgi:hypothetical protein